MPGLQEEPGSLVREEDFEHLRGRLDLEDVILPALGIDVSFMKGHEICVRCPNWTGLHSHGDRRPSMYINDDKLLWECKTGCGAGTIIHLVQLCLGFTEEAALSWLEEHSDLAPSDEVSFKDEIEHRLATHESEQGMPEYSRASMQRFEQYEPHPWLEGRGISPLVSQIYSIGWDDDHCGIVIPHMFNRKCVGWQTRHLSEGTSGFQCPTCIGPVSKYKNTQGMPKKTTLYGWDAAQNEGRIIVVESPMSVLYLKSCNAGYNVVATFGGGISSEQGDLLSRFTEGVYLWIDNDSTGLKTVRDAQVILENRVPLYVVPLVPGEKADPGDVKQEEVGSYLEAAYLAARMEMEGLRVGL